MKKSYILALLSLGALFSSALQASAHVTDLTDTTMEPDVAAIPTDTTLECTTKEPVSVAEPIIVDTAGSQQKNNSLIGSVLGYYLAATVNKVIYNSFPSQATLMACAGQAKELVWKAANQVSYEASVLGLKYKQVIMAHPQYAAAVAGGMLGAAIVFGDPQLRKGTKTEKAIAYSVGAGLSALCCFCIASCVSPQI